VQDAPKTVVIVDRIVLRATVVPKGKVMRPPGPSACELGLDLVLKQKRQQ
jgi:hypothetical protein